ncbi:type I polyketide synthase [Methylosoma difficile]
MQKRVAIIAYSFRFPGTDKQNFWNDLLAKRDLITEVDPSRWCQEKFLHPDKRHAGTSYTFAAGSLGDVSGFDAAFFGISPREATSMDPQQRLLLEMAWETFENAGIVPSSMRGSQCGVFIGIASADYAFRLADDLAAIEASGATGLVSSIAANRISYVFDLHGPSIAMDTACSSSLVAFHQACQAIRFGEINMALAGGINLHLHPYGFISFSKATMLSKTGQCHVFDAGGNGYVRSEGGGLFLLKDYDQAVADGDNIIAIVAGSAVNTDGNKAGLTIPNYKAQVELMSDVYRQAEIDPNQISYFEAHGTGTAVGDPIETQAIGLALGQKRKSPLLIGSIKSNLGHLESASGVAGLVKALNCLKHRTIPATIGITTPNPYIKFAEWNIEAVTENQPLSNTDDLIIGVNSFGFGGANAHVILQSPQKNPQANTPKTNHKRQTKPKLPLIFSGKDSTALSACAQNLADTLATEKSIDFYDFAYSNFFYRERHPQAAVVFADNTAEAQQKLTAFISSNTESEQISHIHTGIHLTDAQGPVFVYSGNGCQWHGMGQKLLEQSAVFRDTLAEIDRHFGQYGDFSLVDELSAKLDAERNQLTEIAQPALFALQVGISKVLQSLGINPTAVVGHSVGEVAAAWAAGILSLADAVKVIYYRSLHQGKTKGQGQMTAVGLGCEAAQNLLTELHLPLLSIAGINSYRGVTIAGDVEQLFVLERELSHRQTFYKRLDLDYPFHSPAMDSIEKGIRADLAKLTPQKSQIPYFSTVTGTLLAGTELDGGYWWHNIRKPVQFQPSIDAILATGANVFIEIGAHPVLKSYLNDSLKAASQKGAVIQTLKKNHSDLSSLEGSLAQIIISGCFDKQSQIDKTNAWFAEPGKRVNLPNYPWQRQSLWMPSSSESTGYLTQAKVHPLLGHPVKQHERLWENQLDTQLQPFLNDHNVGGSVVFPGAGFVEIALAAAHQVHADAFLEIEELEIRAPLLLSHDHTKCIRSKLENDGRFSLQSREHANSAEWTNHISGRVLGFASGASLALTAPELPSRKADFNQAEHNQLMASIGLYYGPAFQAISHGWTEGNSTIGIFNCPESIGKDLDAYFLHPSFLDCAFQMISQIFKTELLGHDDITFVPVKVGKIYLRANKSLPHLVKISITHRAPHSISGQFSLYDADGICLAVLESVRFRGLKLQRPHTQSPHYFYYQLTAAPRSGESTFKIDPDLLAASLQKLQQSQASNRYSEEIEPLLDSLCHQFLTETLLSLADADHFIANNVFTQLKNQHAGLANLLQETLSEAEQSQQLLAEHDGWRINPNNADELSALEIWNSLVLEYPDYFYLIQLSGRVGLHLHSLLIGTPEPVIASASNSYASIAEHIFKQTGKATLADWLLKQCQQFAEQLPVGGRLRVLEISSRKPEFAALVCSQLDLNQNDYCFASLSENAINAAESLRERFPLLTSLPLYTSDNRINTEPGSKANFAIVHLNTGNVENMQQLLKQLPQLLTANSPVLFIGLQPARWIDQILGLDMAWWVQQTGQDALISPQLDAGQILNQLDLLDFTGLNIQEFLPDSQSGYYVISATSPDNSSEAAQTSAQNWLIMAGYDPNERHLAQRLAKWLETQNQQVTLSEQCWALPEQMEGFQHIIHLSGFAQDDAKLQNQRCELAAEIAKSCEVNGANATVWLLTHQVSQLYGCDQTDAFASNNKQIAHDAALWGFGRSLMNEASYYRPRLLDTPCNALNTSDALLAAITHELLTPDLEQEVFLNAEGKRFVPRLRNRPHLVAQSHTATQDEDNVIQLGFKIPGQLRNLQWQAIDSPPLARDELEIAVKATGLNFRDIMYTLGLLSDEAVEKGFVGPSLGLEFAGIVSRVGADISGFKVGDQVVGMGPSSFSNRVFAKSNAVGLIPKQLSFAAAATIPSTFFTVYYALHHQARLQPGEKVLIHGAAGGVGIAAIQVARWLGADIFATVGSAEKRDFMALLGVDRVYDSRSLSFAEDILAATQQGGVDVVLNSLAGEAINRNFQVLKPFGRFLELGKRDFYENTHIGLRPFRNNISYFGIDADQLMQERPDLARKLFAEVMALFHSGVLHPLPYTTFDANQVVDAFRYMQQAKQIGKVVVTYDNSIYLKPASLPSMPALLQLPATASYLVTGGLSGLGLKTAQWLVTKGARHLILVSRSGAASEEAQTAIAQLRNEGVTVFAEACDISDKVALKELLADCQTNMPPLKGIVHAAAVIEDGLVFQSTPEQIQRVLAPKIMGALHLHELTAGLPLDWFVMYSSVTTLFGNPGQSNYVAANLWLEALAAQRQQQGLPATCICLGAIEDVGFLARNEKIKEALQSRMGGAALSSEEALAQVEQMITSQAKTVGISHYDWRSLSTFLPSSRSPKFYELALHSPHADNNDDQRADLKQLLSELSDEELKSRFIDMLKDELSQILLIAKDKIDEHQSMYDMGLDSLMGVELMIAIESRFDVQIPVMALSEVRTLNKLAERLATSLRGENEDATDTSSTAAIADLSRRHNQQASQEEIMALSKTLDANSTGKIINH